MEWHEYMALLIGLPQSGKTQLLRSLRGESYDNPEDTDTDIAYTKSGATRVIDNLTGKMGGEKFGRVLGNVLDKELASTSFSVYEYGGKLLVSWKKDDIKKQLIKCCLCIVVFNGNDFIRELQDYEHGGQISTLIRNYILPTYEMVVKEYSERKVVKALNAVKIDEYKYPTPFFLATHEDEYSGNRTMHEDILQLLKEANRSYQAVSLSERYPFANLFPGHLKCVNAKDYNAVQKVFDDILKK